MLFRTATVESPGCIFFLTQDQAWRGGGGGGGGGLKGVGLGGGCWSVGQPTEQWIRRPQVTVQEQQAARAVGWGQPQPHPAATAFVLVNHSQVHGIFPTAAKLQTSPGP
jgi:hypothetical protein